MIDKLKQKLSKKQNEILKLKKQIELQENQKYGYLIGKIIKLSTTCIFKVDGIDYIDHYHIHVIGLKIFFENTTEGEFRIELKGSESIDLNHGKIDEIRVCEFIDYTYNGFLLMKQNIERLLQ